MKVAMTLYLLTLNAVESDICGTVGYHGSLVYKCYFMSSRWLAN